MPAKFSGLVYGSMDFEEPTGWVTLQAVLVVPEDGGQVRCVEVFAADEAGVVIELEREQREEFARRFVDAYQRGRGRRVY